MEDYYIEVIVKPDDISEPMTCGCAWDKEDGACALAIVRTDEGTNKLLLDGQMFHKVDGKWEAK